MSVYIFDILVIVASVSDPDYFCMDKDPRICMSEVGRGTIMHYGSGSAKVKSYGSLWLRFLMLPFLNACGSFTVPVPRHCLCDSIFDPPNFFVHSSLNMN